MPSFDTHIKSWGAWGPGLDTAEALSAWACGTGNWLSEGQPDMSFLPLAARRRLSPLCKMALAALYRCTGSAWPSGMPSVFASRYGENRITSSILEDIVCRSPVSPMKFSLSTHNSVAGIYSIQANTPAPSTSIAAEEDTFGMALLDAVTTMKTSPHSEVLVVMCEEPLAERYEPFLSEQQLPYAIALVLSRQEGTPVSTSFTSTPVCDRPADTLPLALQFLKWFLQGAVMLRGQGRHYEWSWER
ncbi:MAG: beta-ketoacyl synthase chain length factor [Verrucomicrobia bacterium]|nr:beta-ketoacyl synthase chain length factor [Verrucomicrobiota bacterium]